MNRPYITAIVALVAAISYCIQVRAQVAGTATIDIAVARLEVVAEGWSAKRQILGRPVYNEQSEQIGKIDDLIISPDSAVSFAIIGAGGFVGVKRHQVAISVDQLFGRDGLFVLPGATKAAIKARPGFDHAH